MPNITKKNLKNGLQLKESYCSPLNKLMDFKEFISINENTTWQLLKEATATRYSVEVNYNTKMKEVAENFAKIALGYISAAAKSRNLHVKHVYDIKPIRILVSSRNWDDGEWVGIVSFNPEHDGGCFVISKGFYNQERRSISLQNSQKCTGTSAAEVAKELLDLMQSVKDQPDRHLEKLKPAPLKRGPKR